MPGVQKNLTKKPYEYIYLTKYHLSTMAGQIQVSSVSSKPSYFGQCWHTQSDDRTILDKTGVQASGRKVTSKMLS